MTVEFSVSTPVPGDDNASVRLLLCPLRSGEERGEGGTACEAASTSADA